MKYIPSPLYSQPIPLLNILIESCIERGLKRKVTPGPVKLFFRADDIGVPSRLFIKLIEMFQHHQLPLCLAVVPSWLTHRRYEELRSITGWDDHLFCWHQHGRVHHNFEMSGKKQEFGPGRSFDLILDNLQQGRDRLQKLLDSSFSLFFTPPWNRCSIDAALALRELGFQAISRSTGARPDFSGIIKDIQVNVDLHTRKEPDPTHSLEKLLLELEDSIASGWCGIMIHHQRMNNHAFILLDQVMTQLTKRDEILPQLFADLL